MPEKLNLGGGGEWAMEGWQNLDIDLGYDLRQNFLRSFSDSSIAKIYCSHILEHMPVADAYRLVVECHRVLKAGGRLRLVVPDCQKFSEAWLNKEHAIFSSNPYLTVHFPAYRDCFVEMGGSASSLDHPSVIQHYFFWDLWTLTWLFVRAGFDEIYPSAFGKSVDGEMKEVATMIMPQGMPARGFDNPLTESISVYLEVIKS